jgi:hypothetical protein
MKKHTFLHEQNCPGGNLYVKSVLEGARTYPIAASSFFCTWLSFMVGFRSQIQNVLIGRTLIRNTQFVIHNTDFTTSRCAAVAFFICTVISGAIPEMPNLEHWKPVLDKSNKECIGSTL